MKKRYETLLCAIKDKRGMTLTEMLVAMAVLVIAIMCFLPLVQTSFKNVYFAGERTKENYAAVGLIEKLIGHTGANGNYEVSTDNVPLRMQAKTEAIQSNTAPLQSINGVTISSKPDSLTAGFSTFICDSVTAKMVCYPSHIADDFRYKTITLYASGFRFSAVNEFKIYYTDASGNRQIVPGSYNGANPYCNLKIDKDNASIAYLTLTGDNSIINFERSPLTVEYRTHSLQVEIDAPTVIMVGEADANGNYYYYVTSGETDENGDLEIIRRKMDGIDPNTGDNVTLTASMNDVEWVAPGAGDDGKGGVNQYGYYVMCGDNGQIRRFWKNSQTGNYGWGGDWTVKHEYYYKNGVTEESNKREYDTTVDSSFAYVQTPAPASDKIESNDPTAGINLIPDIDNRGYNIFDTLYTQTAFSVNALNKDDFDVYTAGNLLYLQNTGDSSGNPWNDYINRYLNRNIGASNNIGWLDLSVFRSKGPSDEENQTGVTTDRGTTVFKDELEGITFGHRNATVLRRANDMISYADYNGLDQTTTNYITLTSVSAVTMENSYSSNKYPTQSYTLYSGYIPAVMDIWAPKIGVENHSAYNFGEWRATLGIAFLDNSDTSYFTNLGTIFNGGYSYWGGKTLRLAGMLWTYGGTEATRSAATKANYALSGMCGPSNYASSKALVTTIAKSSNASANNGYNKEFYPLNVWDYQAMLQLQDETVVSVSYLSHPYALSGSQLTHNTYDLSQDRHDYDGVYEWVFDDSVTIMDADSMYYEDYDGNGGHFSVAVGYYVGGLAYENQSSEARGMLTTPTVMNNGVVYLRAGGADEAGLGNGFTLQQESNVFNEFFSTNDYWRKRKDDWGSLKNTLKQAVSAGYWRDAYHPLFYSLYGGEYVCQTQSNIPKYSYKARDQYSYLMSHILQGKRLTSVAWGTTWNESPEAMWGASDGTLMSWYLDLNDLESGDAAANNDESVTAEFQSYQWLQRAIEFRKTNSTNTLASRYSNIGPGVDNYQIPTSVDDMTNWQNKDNADDENSYWDKCSAQLGMTGTLGFISPLDTIEDVCYANDTWVAAGVQGLANPRYDNDGNPYCKQQAVVKRPFSSDQGSWICVRSWYDQSGGKDRGPVDGNCNFIWQAIQISTIRDCNIQQVTYTNGMWYAVGYIDTNNNGMYDYTPAPGQEREHAVVFYAVDPAQPCGTTQGWRLSNPGSVGYTQAYYNTGAGEYELLNIDGVNSVASRND